MDCHVHLTHKGGALALAHSEQGWPVPCGSLAILIIDH